MQRWIGLFTFLGMMTWCTSAAMAVTQQLTPTADVWLEENNPTANHGTDKELRARGAGGDREWVIYHVDVSGWSDGPVTNAMLQVFVTDEDALGGKVQVYLVQKSWAEGTANWSNLAAFVDTTASLGQFQPTAPGSYAVNVTSAVQNWISSGTNFGLALVPEVGAEHTRYTSRDFDNVDARPSLWVSSDILSPNVSLGVDKVADVTTPTVADSVRYTVTVQNKSASTATGVQLTDQLPGGLTFLTSGVTQGSYNPVDGLWNVGSLGGLSTATLFIVSQVDSGTIGDTIVNTASVSALDQSDFNSFDDADSVAITVIASGPDLAITKTVDSETVVPGQLITYTVGVRNVGTQTTTNLWVDDALPAGVTYSDYTATQGNYAFGAQSWLVGTLAPGDSASLFLDATVDAATEGQTITNVAARGSHTGTDLNPSNDADSASVVVLSADLAVTKSVDNAAPFEGDNIEYLVTVENLGPTETSSARITDVLPAGLTFVSDSTTAGTYDDVNGRWQIGDLTAGTVDSLWITAQVDDGTAGDTITNTAAVETSVAPDAVPGNDSASVDVIVRSADLELVMSGSEPTPEENETFLLSYQVNNAGPDDAFGVSVGLTIPSGLTVDSVDLVDGGFDGGSGIWTIGSIANGDSANLDLSVTVDPGTAGSVFNPGATLGIRSPGDPNPGNDSGSFEITVQSADLVVTKAVSNPRPNEGDTVIYTVTVENLGPFDATGVQLIDQLPAGVSFQFDSPSQGTYDDGSGVWDVGDVNVGEIKTLALLSSVDAATALQAIVNRADVLATSPVDPVAANDSMAVGMTVLGADLSLTKVSNKATAFVNTSVTFTIDVANAGPDSATNVVVVDQIPSPLIYQGDSPSHGDYDQISGDWDIGAIAPGDTATLVVTTLVPGGAAGAVVTNVASISTVDQADTNPGAEADSVTVSVNNALPLELADLEIVMAVDNATPSVGDTVQWELEISNAGPDPATSVTVSDVLPAGLTYSGSGTTTGSYNPSNGIWTIGTIATGVADTLYLYATVDESAAGLQITNNATASANQPDPSGTASDNASINVPVADLELTKTVDQTLPTVGDSLVYTLTLVNLGGDATGGVFVADTIPAGLSVTSSSATRGSYSPATGLWSVGPMAAADTVSLDIFADVDPAAAGNTLWNVASIFASGEGDSAAANNVDSAAVRVTYADLQIESLVSNGVPDEGDTITWTTTLENLGLDATTTTAVTAAIPAGLTYVTHVASSGSFASGTGAWDVGPVSATPETLTVTLTVDAATGGTTIPLAASVTSDLYDPTPANDNDSIDVNVLVPTGLVVSGFQTARVVNPGQSNVALWSLSLANSTGGSVSVSEIRFDNRTTGIGTQNQLDAELGTVRLHQDDGSGTFEPAQDPSIATGTVAAGEVVFGGLGLTLPSFAAGIYHVVVDVPQDGARDGDVLDVRLPSGASFDAGGANVLGTFPIDPAGGLTVNGVVAAQVGVTPLPDAGVEKGTTALAFAATLPPNGYAPDMLEELRVFNRGTAVVADLSAVKAWSDGGDGAFDAGAGDDTFLGLLTFGVGTWDLTGLTVAIPTTGLDLWVSADLAIGGTAGRTLQFAIPATNGLVTSGGNSGPLDGATTASRTVSITEPPTPIRAVEVPQVLHTLLPGAKSEIVYRFLVINEGTQAETLETITFTNTSTGAPSATQADLDQNWRPLEVQRVRSADVTGVGGSGVGDLGLEGNEVRTLAKSFADGTLEVDLAEVLAPGDSALFRVFSGAALTARDGDQLDLRIEAATDLKFTNPVNLQGVFPLDPAGTHTVDGMAAAQLAFFDIPPSLLTGSTRNLVADFLVPANGYENDTMLRLDLVNLGDAEPGTDIDKIELWRDGDGSGDFNPGLDTLLGEMLFTGDRWERTGLSSPVVAGSGLRLFVTADVAELATAGRELRLAVAGPPEPGIGMLSDNDGPIDGAIGGSGATISTVDRVTFAPQNLGPRVVSPGEVGVPLLTVSAENTYSVEKTLTALTVTNTSTGAGSTDDLDREISLLTLWADDGDGTFEGAPQDTALATSFFESGAASFGAFGWSLAAAEVRRLFVTGEVSGPSATDGDVLAAEISGPTSMQFSDVTSLTASWPLDSNAAATVDGTVAAQFTNLGAPATTLGSGEGPSLALDVVLPSNGYLVDELNSFTVTNLGDATDADLAEVRLWRDGGDGVFDAGVGDDADLGLLAAFGNDWANPSLSESIPAAGARVFVSITADPSPSDSATVRLAIPVDGLDYASAADGPRDGLVANPEATVLSTGVLLATLELDPPATIINSPVTATMRVRNLHPTAELDSVMPLAPLEVIPSTGLTLVSGPTPALHSLLPGEEKEFTWTYSATFIGDVRVRGAATGVEVGGAMTRHTSLSVQSNVTQVFIGAQTLDLYAVASMPFSINRGQTGVVPMTLTFRNPSGPNGTDIELTGLRVRLESEQGAGIVPADLLSRVVVNEGAEVYLDKTSLETAGADIDLTLATPVLIESSGSSSQATIGIALDISDSTSVPNFSLRILDATWFAAEDATTGGPVTLELQDPPAFPVSSGLARVVAEATQLDVAGNALADETVGQGQNDVVVLDLTLQNPDPTGLAADVRVTAFDLSVCDSSGTAIDTPRDFVDRVRVKSPSITHLDYVLSPSDGAVISLALGTLISAPVNTPVPLTVEVDLTADAELATFRVMLADTAGFDARDANTGTPLPVFYSPDPIEGPRVTVQAPAQTLQVASSALMPSEVPVGSVDVASLGLVLTHPGTPVEGPVELTSLTVLCRDAANAPVVPSTVVDRLVLRRAGEDVAVVTNVPASGGEILVPVTGVVLAPGDSESLQLEFDVEVTAPAELFGFTVGSSGVTARDANLGTPVTVEVASGEFPLSSGLAQLEAPARTLAVGFTDDMPATLVADGSLVRVATISLRNAAAANAGTIRVDELTLRASNRAGDLIDLGSCVTSLTLWQGDLEWAASGPIDGDDGKVTLTATEALELSPDVPVELTVEMELRQDAPLPELRIGLLSEDIGVIQPGSPLLSISVLPEDGEFFPFWTESGTFRGQSLEESYSNFPNPFAAGREETTIAFYLPEDGAVSLKVYSMRGELVRTLLEGDARSAGLHQDLTWDGRNGNGVVVVNGVYLAEFVVALASGGTEKMLRKVAVVR